MSLREYRIYLEKRDISEATIREHEKMVASWITWLEIPVEKAKYKDVLDYVGYLHEIKKSAHRINKAMQAIGHYYKSLGLEDIAANVRIRGAVKTAVIPSLRPGQLDKIYDSFELKLGHLNYMHSDKLILGMIIYQGVDWSDFLRIELRDVDIKSGKLYIPETRQKKSRYVKLQAHQILDIYKYINEHREEVEGSEIFLSPQGMAYNQMHWQYKLLSKEVKRQAKEKLDIEVVKLSHLKQSRIRQWVEEHGLRKAQYLAGFRSVLSVERYQNPDMKNLKMWVKKHHPW